MMDGWMDTSRVTRISKVMNEYVKESLPVAPVVEKLQGNRLSWFKLVNYEKRGNARGVKSNGYEC